MRSFQWIFLQHYFGNTNEKWREPNMRKKGFTRAKSNRRCQSIKKIKTYRMRYKEGEKEIASSRYIMSRRANRFKNTKRTKKQNKKKVESCEKKTKTKKTRVWEKASGREKRKKRIYERTRINRNWWERKEQKEYNATKTIRIPETNRTKNNMKQKMNQKFI